MEALESGVVAEERSIAEGSSFEEWSQRERERVRVNEGLAV